MWTRELLKTNAKHALAGRYWMALAACLISYLPSVCVAMCRVNTQDWTFADYYYRLTPGLLLGLPFVAALLNIFLLMPLEVARDRFMMENRQGSSPLSTLLTVFQSSYLNVALVRFLVNLKITLGFIVIVPGILWSYQYAMVPYLLAESPALSAGRAMELSRDMMVGEKWNFFVLQLSFILWCMLSLVTVGLAGIFTAPYFEATYAEFYAAMRAKAFALGLSDEQELGGFYTW